MRGPIHAAIHHTATVALGGALALAAAPVASADAIDPGELPRCSDLSRSVLAEGEISSPWQAVLDEEGVVTGHRLTLRHEGREHRLRTTRRSFVVRGDGERLLIGVRGERATRLHLVDTARACLRWQRQVGRLLYPRQDEATGAVRFSAHAPDSRRYEATHVVDLDSGRTEAMVTEDCLEHCLPSDGEIDPAALTAARAVKPTPPFAAGGWAQDRKLTYRWKPGAVPPSWARQALQNGAADATTSAAARGPRFVHDSGAANEVSYSGTMAGFCGSAAIACAGRAMPSYWGVWIRPYGTDFAWGTLRWCQKTSSSSRCFDIRRVMLHELGHIAGLNHPSSAGFTLAPGDSVMQAITPSRPQPGASRHAFGRCDVATLQELYDTPDNKTAISSCNDVATTLSLSASPWTIEKGRSVKLVATLKVADKAAYGRLGGNPLNGRSVKLKYRRAGSDDPWKTAWMRSAYRQGRYDVTLAPAATWEYKAVFNRPADEGLRYSRSGIKKVKVNR
jgi:hypothetical protein